VFHHAVFLVQVVVVIFLILVASSLEDMQISQCDPTCQGLRVTCNTMLFMQMLYAHECTLL
jgi:hypothetical protein